MCDYISFSDSHLKDNSGQERVQACQMENTQVQKNVSMEDFFLILMLSETVLQADKMETSNKCTFLLYSPIPQMANITKTSSHKDS